jgi:DNA gyrase subunit A
VLVRTPVKDISVVGRNTQGVRLIRLEDGDQLSGLERIDGIVEGVPDPDDPAAGEPAASDATTGDATAGDPTTGPAAGDTSADN